MQLTSRTSLDLPRASGPTSHKRGNEGASLDIQPLGNKECKIVGCGDRISRDVSTESGETEGKSDEKGSGSRGPEGDDTSGIPVKGAVNGLNMISIWRLSGTYDLPGQQTQ